MGKATCIYDGCSFPTHARGYCATHNWRIKTWGSPDKQPRPRRAEEDRFWSKVDASGDCWPWTASVAGGGYGWFAAEGGSVPAHRWSYEHLVGPVPADLDLDHLCRNRRCVNPDHLEPVTRAENMRRAPWDAPKYQLAKTHCPQGHPYAGGNLLIDQGRRRCRACRNAYERALRQRNKERRDGRLVSEPGVI